jgi:uncharacterized protein (TIGR00299 family) protein
MSRVLVIDPSIAGISGDMLLGGFIGLGFKPEKVVEVANVIEKAVPWVRDFKIRVKEVKKFKFKAWRVDVLVDEERRCRRASDLLNSIEKVSSLIGLSNKASRIALEAVKILVEAEAEVHGEDVDDVDLCEISSADTVLDTVGVAYALQELDLLNAKVYGLPIAVGGGRIQFSHGSVSIPTPVVLEIAKKKNLILVGGPVDEELATPTGVALYAVIVDEVKNLLPMTKIVAVGYGAGSRDLKSVPNILRLIIGEELEIYTEDTIYVLETDIDDVSGEILGFVGEKLVSQGALDIAFIPKIGKKGRPSFILRVLTKLQDLEKLLDIVVKETGTLGVRVMKVHRYIVPNRDIVKTAVDINGEKYEVRVKISRLGDGEVISVKPEFEDLKDISIKTGIPLRNIMKIVMDNISNEQKL